jgi:transcriptional regulator with XRE-family HTH domain
MALNAALQRAIRESGLKQTFIADRVGINESRLSRIVRGHIDASEHEKKALALVLNARVAQLFSEAKGAAA